MFTKLKESKTENTVRRESENFTTFLTGKAKENHEKQWEYIKEIFKKWKSNYGKDPGKKIEKTEIGIQRQLKASDKGLSELLRDGIELISNIRIANDKREIERRLEEADIRDILIKDLSNESQEADKKLEVIKKHWLELNHNSMIDPMELHEGLEYQRKRIVELMQQKDEIVKELKEAIVNSDDRYYMDQQKQIADIYCLVERIDMQVDVMKRAFREHIEILQNSIDEEKRRFLQESSETWYKVYDERAESEEAKLTNQKDKTEFYDQEINRIICEHKEIIRSTKIRLDTDNDTLQIELENVKAEVMLNSEKLDYNYRILIKRADENVITRNQQKRRLSKLQEIIRALKERSQRVRKLGNNEIGKFNLDITKLSTSIDEMKTKSKLFSDTNDQKFQTIWDISEAEAIGLLEKITNIDETIYGQQLGIEWERPHEFLLQKTDLPSFANAIDFQYKKSNNMETELTHVQDSDRLTREMNQKFTRLMLDRISIQTQWLVDDKLDGILKPYKDLDKTLVKVDNVFVALNINSMEDVKLLKDHFLYYAWCPNCSENNTKPGMSTTSADSRQIVEKEECTNHYLVIESSYVLPALRQFVENRKKAMPSDGRNSSNNTTDQLKYQNMTVSRLLKEEDIVRYWKTLSNAMPLHKIRLWNGLEHGLNEYLNILKKREKLNAECEFLRNQNAELHHLLQRYIPSDTNSPEEF